MYTTYVYLLAPHSGNQSAIIAFLGLMPALLPLVKACISGRVSPRYFLASVVFLLLYLVPGPVVFSHFLVAIVFAWLSLLVPAILVLIFVFSRRGPVCKATPGMQLTALALTSLIFALPFSPAWRGFLTPEKFKPDSIFTKSRQIDQFSVRFN